MTHVETPVDEVDEAQTPVEPRGRRRFTLGQRFFLVFGFESLMIIGLALLGGIQLSLQGADEVDAIEDVDAVHTSLYDLNEALWQVRVQGMALTIDATTLQEFDDAYTDFTADYAHAFGEAFVEDQEMVAAWETLKASGMTSADDVNFVIFNSSVQEALESAADQVAAMTADEIASTEAHAQTVVLVFVVLAAIGVAHGILLGVIMTRRIGGSVRRLKDVTQAMADGDLTVDVSIDSSDEIGDMARSLARAQSSLRETMAGVVSSAVTVAAAAEELSAANAQVDASSQQTVAGASVVASSADEVSRSVQAVASGAEQMGASIKEISHNANEAARVAAQATDVAESTNEKVGRLGASSQEIGEVIKV
ncbi:HAMP domain-containing protein, partial [Demequina mangrovi]